MSGAVSEAEGRPTGDVVADDYDDLHPFELHVRRGPPLAWLAALAALASLAINQVALPALNSPLRRSFLLWLDRWGDFATNLAAVAGLVALSLGLLPFVRHSDAIALRRRLMLACFAGIFIPTVGVSTLFVRERTTTQIVLFALGAAHVLGTLVCTGAARLARGRVARTTALVLAAMAVFTLVAQVLQIGGRVTLDEWHGRAFHLLEGAAELAYLTGLLLLSLLSLPGRANLRERIARIAVFFFTPVFVVSLTMIERMMKKEYVLLLYHAERVQLFVDSWPRLYSVPLGIALATGLASGASGDPVRRQAGAATLLLLSAGFAPHAPGRLLSLALSMVLAARVVGALAELGAHQAAARAPAR